MAPHAAHLRNGVKMGELKFVDTMIKDGLMRRLPRLSHGQHRREHRRQVADQPRGPGPLRHRLAEQGRGGAEGRPVQGRDRALHGPEPQGRHRRRRRRIHPRRRDLRGARQAAARLHQGRHGDRRQRLRHQRRRRGAGADDRGRGGQSAASRRWRASPPGRPPASIRRSWAPARSPPRARRWRRPAGRSRISTSSRPTRPSPPRRSRSTRTWAGIPRNVNVNGGAIAIGHPDRRLGRAHAGDAAARDGSAATPRRAWRRCASAAAWASR